MPVITVVTVTYNSSAVIGQLLRSLAGLEAAIIVVDNGSGDNTVEFRDRGFLGERNNVCCADSSEV